MALTHGGNLSSIKQVYPEFDGTWLDLSTGVSPYPYDIQNLELNCLTKLPDQDETLLRAAKQYYGVARLLMTPGSIWSIKQLPNLIKNQITNSQHVLVPASGFSEHRLAWECAGFEVETYEQLPSEEQLMKASVCVVINPNNPTGLMLNKSEMSLLLRKTKAFESFLIMDEAFIDTRPSLSVIGRFNDTWPDHLIVLRSFGKFFGLPGLRLGALVASEDILSKAEDMLGPWGVNSIAQNIAMQAYQDEEWQQEARDRIIAMARLVSNSLAVTGFKIVSSDLFVTCYTDAANTLWKHLLSFGVYTRLLDDKTGIRIGLPSNEIELKRLINCITRFNEKSLKVAS